MLAEILPREWWADQRLSRVTAASRALLLPASEWECQGPHLSRWRKSPGTRFGSLPYRQKAHRHEPSRDGIASGAAEAGSLIQDLLKFRCRPPSIRKPEIRQAT